MGSLKIIAIAKSIISAMPVVRRRYVTFLILSYANLPSSTPATIDEKLSSVIIIEAVSFVTSVPEPIATPIFAFFKAGASFIPSPVTAIKWPSLLKASTIFSFCRGVTLANTFLSFTKLSNSLSVPSAAFCNSSPFATLLLPPEIIPICFAILPAVAG